MTNTTSWFGDLGSSLLSCEDRTFYLFFTSYFVGYNQRVIILYMKRNINISYKVVSHLHNKPFSYLLVRNHLKWKLLSLVIFPPSDLHTSVHSLILHSFLSRVPSHGSAQTICITFAQEMRKLEKRKEKKAEKSKEGGEDIDLRYMTWFQRHGEAARMRSSVTFSQY